MGRIHALEILDLSGCPEAMRRWGTEYLAFVTNFARGFEPVVPHLVRGLDAMGTRRIVDLCSGSSGPWPHVLPPLAERLDEVVETDLHPRPAVVEAVAGVPLRAWPDSVDAQAVPEELDGLRVVFNGIHHFRPDGVRRVLSDAVHARQGILTAEGTRRDPLMIAVSFILIPLMVLAMTPFIRPVSIGRFVFTYGIPVMPAVIWFDGLVSCLRTYTPGELLELARTADPDETFTWEAGLAEGGRGMPPVTWLLGTPRQPPAYERR